MSITPAVCFFHHWHKPGGSLKSLCLLVSEFAELCPNTKIFVFIPGSQCSSIAYDHLKNFAPRILFVDYYFNICFDSSCRSRQSYLYFPKIIFSLIFFLPVSLYILIVLLFVGAFRGMRYRFFHFNELGFSPLACFLSIFFRAPRFLHNRALQDHSLLAFLIHLMAFFSTKIVSIDSRVASSLLPYLSKKVEVFFNPLDSSPSSFNAPRLVTVSGRFSARTVGFVGSLIYNKGLDTLLASANILSKRDPSIKFVVAGPLSSLTKSEAALISTGLQPFSLLDSMQLPNVIFTDYVSDLNVFYDKISVLVFPSRYDSVGRPVLEASSRSIPSIVRLNYDCDDFFINDVSGLRLTSNSGEILASSIEIMLNDYDAYCNYSVNAHSLYVDAVVSSESFASFLSRI